MIQTESFPFCSRRIVQLCAFRRPVASGLTTSELCFSHLLRHRFIGIALLSYIQCWQECTSCSRGCSLWPLTKVNRRHRGELGPRTAQAESRLEVQQGSPLSDSAWSLRPALPVGVLNPLWGRPVPECLQGTSLWEAALSISAQLICCLYWELHCWDRCTARKFFLNSFILFYFCNLMEQYHLYIWFFLKKPISLKTSVLNAEHFRIVIRRLFQSQIEKTRNEVPFWGGKKESNKASSTYNICNIKLGTQNVRKKISTWSSVRDKLMVYVGGFVSLATFNAH